jgi:hexosaminidase
MKLYLDATGMTAPLAAAVDQLAVEFPFVKTAPAAGSDEVTIRFQALPEKGRLEIVRKGRKVRIGYGTTAQALRGLGSVLSGLLPPNGTQEESTPFETFGIMLDCSRNAVMTPDHVKRWLRRLALMGYNMAMLYTENTYALPGEDYFGYRRGRYTLEELQDIDRCAADLGIEMIGCIQVLGHLEQLLRWPEYGAVRDTASVLLVGEEHTYALIAKMIAFWKTAFRSRRLHIGMDETFDLGRGRYMNLHGYKRGYDLFNEHLARVSGLCGQHGIRPMIWSDMYFRMGSATHDYYDPRCEIPADVKAAIPKQVQLVYWDYDHTDPAFYTEWIRRHRELGSEPVMATAVATVQRPWLMRSEPAVNACLSACREAGLRELVVCLWGDDGAYCEFDSALAGLAQAAEAAYGVADLPPEKGLAERFKAICGSDYDAVMTAAAMNDGIHPMVLVWDDPLLRVAWRNEGLKKADAWTTMDSHFAVLLRRLAPVENEEEPVDLAHACRLLEFARSKIRLNQVVDAAYASRKPKELAAARARAKAARRALEKLMESFRRQWHRRNKPFGLETIQIRFGGQLERFRELDRRLEDLAAGRLASVPEFEEQPSTDSAYTHVAWRYLAVSGLI